MMVHFRFMGELDEVFFWVVRVIVLRLIVQRLLVRGCFLESKRCQLTEVFFVADEAPTLYLYLAL